MIRAHVIRAGADRRYFLMPGHCWGLGVGGARTFPSLKAAKVFRDRYYAGCVVQSLRAVSQGLGE